MAGPIYEVTRLEHSYHDRQILNISHLAIPEGSIVGLVGPNGSGKSTLLRLLGLIEKPTGGTVRFDGRPVEPFAGDARFKVALLPQDPCLMKRNVFRNVAYGLRLRGNGNPLEVEVHRALEFVGLAAGEFSRRPWYALSGGETLRVALAARLVLKPRVLLLDEPTAGVDAASAHLIKDAALRAQRQWGTTLIVASHDRPWLYEVCSSVLHLFKGSVFGTGHETILFGPWKQFEDGTWGQVLSDNQLLRIPEPPEPHASAVVDNLMMEEALPLPPPDEVRLQGFVSRLNVVQNTGQVFATVVVKSLSFTVALTQQQISHRSIYPGKTVHLCYNLDRIRWI
jgi:tungstate transport system ATP-binding protein